MTEKDTKQVSTVEAKITKNVRNKSGHRVELVIDGKVVVFYPGTTTQVPADFNVPGGLGLYVR